MLIVEGGVWFRFKRHEPHARGEVAALGLEGGHRLHEGLFAGCGGGTLEAVHEVKLADQSCGPILFGAVADALGLTYMLGAAVLGGAFLWYAYRLRREPDRPAAARLYKYSLLYLALLLVLVMVDSVIA